MSARVAHLCDDAAVLIARSRGRLDLAIGETLVALFRGDRLAELGYARQVDYAKNRLGIPARTMFMLTRLAREMAARPVMREAVFDGRVSPRRALDAIGCREEVEFESIVVRMNEEQHDRLDAALALAGEVIGCGSKRWQRLEVLAQEWLGEFAAFAPDERGPIEVEWTEAPVDRHLSALSEAEGDLPRDALGLDARVRRLLAARREYDLVIGPLLLRIFQERLWRYLGYRSFAEYVTERLSMSARSGRQRLWLTRRLCALPEIREAMACGRLTYTKALIVAKDATSSDVVERIEEASVTTCQEVERESTAEEDRQDRAAGRRRLWGPAEAFETVSLAITSAMRCAEVCGEVIDVGEAIARIAGHFVAVWTEHLRGRKVPKRRKEVLMRNGGLCAAPGCSREASEEHHIVYRSRGGPDEVWNLVGLCAVHHRRGVHRGRLVLTGRAGERLVWRFGSGEEWVVRGEGPPAIMSAVRR